MNDLTFFGKNTLSVFDDIFAGFPHITLSSFKNTYPRCNSYVKDDKYIIEATVPGLTKKDIQITWENDWLIFKYHKENKKEDSKTDNKISQYFTREIHQSSFERSMWLPQTDFDVKSITASVENGLLTITVPMCKNNKPSVLTINVN